MKSLFRATIVMCCAVIALAQSSTLAAAPKVFSKTDFNKAKEQTRKNGKLLIADAMAVWCGPCKQMDKKTWVDPKVVEWIKKNAVAVQIDVDREKKLASQLRITAMPTVIIYRDGEEFGRVVGYQSPEQLLQWLESAKPSGGVTEEPPPAKADDPDKPKGKAEIDDRYKNAEKLLRSGKYDEATQEYLWLWDNMLKEKPAMAGVRLSFMVNNMTELAKKHEPAQQAFSTLRDRYERAIDARTADFKTVNDWIHLNKVIQDDEATLAWFDEVKDEPQQEHLLNLLSYVLVDFLVEHDRWAGAGKIMRDPVKNAREQLQMLEEMPPMPDGDEAARRKENIHKHVRDDIAKLYAACLAADREDAAAGIARQLLKAMDTDEARLALVDWALGAGEPRKAHRAWLEQAKASLKRTDLQKKLETALAQN